MVQKNRCAQNCRKSMSFPLAAGLTRDNLPLEHARELCEHLKDSCNLVCIEKTLLRLAFGVFGGCR